MSVADDVPFFFSRQVVGQAHVDMLWCVCVCVRVCVVHYVCVCL